MPATLLVAVSGGQDSLALLHALAALTRGRGARALRLVVAHVDHQLRDPDTAEREREFVAGQAERLGLPMLLSAVDVHAIAQVGRCSLEDAARRGRYRALAALADEGGADAVTTGHTATDQAETVLMRLLHGAGVRGLAAMRHRSPWPVGDGPPLLRPLLDLTREQTAAYCQALGLTPVLDESNASSLHTRNRIRAELMPVLARENPAIVRALARSAASAAVAADLVDSWANRAWGSLVRPDGDGFAVEVTALRAEPEAIRHELLRRLVELAAGGAPAARGPHIAALARLLDRPPGSRCQLPRGWQALRAAGELRIGPAGLAAAPALSGSSVAAGRFARSGGAC